MGASAVEEVPQQHLSVGSEGDNQLATQSTKLVPQQSRYGTKAQKVSGQLFAPSPRQHFGAAASDISKGTSSSQQSKLMRQ